jgi:hypothetical protein
MLTPRYAEPVPACPLVSPTAVLIYQLVLDLYECVGAVWALVATRTVRNLVPLCVYGQVPDVDASLHFAESHLCREHREALLEPPISTGCWTPRLVCPTFVRNEMAGALIFGPKGSPDGYRIEEKELVLEFARHISKLLHKDSMAGYR